MQGHNRNKKELNTDLDVDLNSADIFQGRPGVRKVYYNYIQLQLFIIDQLTSLQMVLPITNTPWWQNWQAFSSGDIVDIDDTNLPISEALTVTYTLFSRSGSSRLNIWQELVSMWYIWILKTIKKHRCDNDHNALRGLSHWEAMKPQPLREKGVTDWPQKGRGKHTNQYLFSLCNEQNVLGNLQIFSCKYFYAYLY